MKPPIQLAQEKKALIRAGLATPTARPLTSQRKKHTIRNRRNKLSEVVLTRTTAINAQCHECLGWETHPKLCCDTNCCLFPFRPGADGKS